MNTIKRYTISSHKTDIDMERVLNSEITEKILRKIYQEDGSDIGFCECFYTLYLNNNNDIVGYAKIAQGGVSNVNVDIRIIIKYAIDTLSSAVIIAHNHPSGGLRPSDHDKKMTTEIWKALKLLNISLLDHVILTEDGYMSMSDDGFI